MNFIKSAACGLGAVLAAIGASPVLGQGAYPSKPITLILPNAPGASTDVYARLYADKLRDNLKQPLVIDFRSGAGGTIGANAVARAPADGYTMGMFSSNFATSTVAYKSLPYDPIESFAPISLTSTDAYLLVLGPSMPGNSVAEYLAYVKANPGKVNIGTTGPGSFNHLSMALLHLKTNTKVTFIHYKGGAQVIADLLAGRIQGSMNTIQLSRPLIASGKVRAVGIASAQRNPAMPEVRTIAEQGVPGYDVQQWRGFVFPARTPAAIVNRMNQEFRAVIKSPDVAGTLEKMGRRPVGSSPEEFRTFLVGEIAQWKNLLQAGDLELGEAD